VHEEKREKKRNWLIRTRVVNAQEKRLYSCMIVFMHVDRSRLLHLFGHSR